MAERGYKIRINVKKVSGNEDRLYCNVSFPDEARELFKKPYVSAKRMQDRLAFVPWDNKTGRGTVAVGANSIQFGLQSDCEKMQDFCGEYNLVNTTDNGIVFVKLADRKPFKRELDTTPSTHDSCPKDVPVVAQPASIKDVLRDAIERKKEDVKKAAEEVVAAENLLAEAKERLAKITDELSAYYVVLNAETGVDK